MSAGSVDELHCFVPTTASLAPSADGELSGLRVAVKDLFAVAGHTSSFGHPRWRATHEPARENATVLTRILARGASVVGFAKMDQLAYSLIGNVGEGEAPINSFDGACYCGGSSSGSASAVAGELADVGLGTDTAGSIRVPAAACGLFGIRPTHDCIDKSGVLPLAPSLDVVGLMARRPEIIEKVLTVVAPAVQVGELPRRILLPTDLMERLEEAEADEFRALAGRIRDIVGGDITEVKLAHLVSSEVGDLFARIQSREIWQQHAYWVEENIEHLAEDVQGRLRRCKALSDDSSETKEADLEARLSYVREYCELVGEDGLLVLPVLPRRGPLRAWSEPELFAYRVECFRLTAPSSLSGAPQVVFPIHQDGRTSPVPASICGLRGSDRALLSITRELAGRKDLVEL